jgi:hypothetical protein
MIDPHVRCLAKKERNIRIISNRSRQFIDDTAQKHCFAFARIPPDPEAAFPGIPPVFKLFVV